MFRISLTNEIGELTQLDSEILEFARTNEITEGLSARIRLIAEELFVNFVSHADSREGHFEFCIELQESGIRLHARYDGQAFNPLSATPPDLNVPLCDRDVGGLGLYLIAQMSSQFEYEYQAARNIIRLSLPSAGEPP